MTFEEILDQAMAMLQRRGRLTSGTLKQQFLLNDAALELESRPDGAREVGKMPEKSRQDAVTLLIKDGGRLIMSAPRSCGMMGRALDVSPRCGGTQIPRRVSSRRPAGAELGYKGSILLSPCHMWCWGWPLASSREVRLWLLLSGALLTFGLIRTTRVSGVGRSPLP